MSKRVELLKSISKAASAIESYVDDDFKYNYAGELTYADIEFFRETLKELNELVDKLDKLERTTNE